MKSKINKILIAAYYYLTQSILCTTIFIFFPTNQASSNDKTLNQHTANVSNTIFEIEDPPRFILSNIKFESKNQQILAIKAGDLNADKFTDILIFDKQTKTSTIYLSDQGHELKLFPWNSIPKLQFPEKTLFADVNGDSCADIFYQNSDQQWKIAFSDCKNGFKEETIQVSNPPQSISRIIRHDFQANKYPSILICDHNEQIQKCFRYDTQDIRHYTHRSQYYLIGVLYSGKTKNDQNDYLIAQRMMPFDSWVGVKNRHIWSIYDGRGEQGNPSAWAMFPRQYYWSTGELADLNGDLREDIISYSNSMLGWWVAFSNNETAIELPTSGLPKPSNAITPIITSGDFNGNGLDEILLLNSKQQIRIYELALRPDGEKTKVLSSCAIQINGNTPGPYLCLGYNFSPKATVSKWWSSSTEECPDNYAIFTTSLVSTDTKKAENVLVHLSCCRLPTDDILINEKYVFVDSECPENHIATGTKNEFANTAEGTHLLRCTAINTTRYQLSEKFPGTPFGVSTNYKYRSNRLDREDLPLAFRYGAQRTDYNIWGRSGCVGFPWGGILTSKNIGGCSGLGFRRLTYRGINNDPPSGTLVKIFPSCDKINNIFDPRSGCQE